MSDEVVAQFALVVLSVGLSGVSLDRPELVASVYEVLPAVLSRCHNCDKS